MPISKIRSTMLCISGFELYSRWVLLDSGVSNSRTLRFLKFPLIRTKLNFPSTVKHYNQFTPVLSNLPIIRIEFAFPKVVL